MLRSGRLGRLIYVGIPNADERVEVGIVYFMEYFYRLPEKGFGQQMDIWYQ